MSTEMPEGWSKTRLGDAVGSIQTGFACGTHNRTAKGIPHLRPMNVSTDGKIVLVDLKFVPAAEVDREERWVRQGDVLFNNTNSPELVGKTAYYGEPGPRAFSNHMTRVRCRDGLIAPRFCAAILHQLWRDGFFGSVCNNHVSQASISRAVLLDTEIPLPPLAEQRRIVEKVEALLACVNAARERLAKVPVILKRFRQAVLAAACSGRLTEGWRKMHRQVVPMGAMLQARRTMARPAVERSARADTCQELATRDLPEIPETWGWARLPELGELNRGKSRHRPRNDPSLLGGNYPFIQTGDVARSDGKITSHSQTYNEAGLAQSRLWPARTVCITIAANIAESALLTYPACFPDSVVGLIADSSLCVAEYAEFFVRTARDDLSQYAPATAQKNINLEILRDVAVPLPPIEEQTEIVQHVEAFLSLVSTVERRVAAATTRTDKLTQSILAKAFRGELVPTEAELARQEGRDYEPASALLERIRAEQAATASGTEGAKPRRTLGRTKRARRGKATSSGR